LVSAEVTVTIAGRSSSLSVVSTSFSAPELKTSTGRVPTSARQPSTVVASTSVGSWTVRWLNATSVTPTGRETSIAQTKPRTVTAVFSIGVPHCVRSSGQSAGT
jgi:hypothetical protein